MNDDRRDIFQMRFENGSLAEQSDSIRITNTYHTADLIEPGQWTGFVAEAKLGALDVNSQLREVVEDYASQLSTSDGSLKIQAVPENESKDIDAYLLADHNPSIKQPAEV